MEVDMISLPILPAQMRIPLDDVGYPGVVAVARPLDNDELAKWADAFPTEEARHTAAVAIVRQQLITIEGVTMRAADGAEVPYDQATHFRSLPTKMIGAIYAALVARLGISEEKKSVSPSPSVSDATTSSGS